MRTRVIPAQITTVEDKIVGNLNIAQMLMLMAPVFFTTLVYTLFPPTMSFVLYKLIMSLIVFMVCTTLSLRIKGKVIANWLAVLLRYNLRAKYYIYNKNEVYLRTIYLPEIEKQQVKQKSRALSKKKVKEPSVILNIQDLVSVENIISNGDLDLRYKTGKKGGLNVAFEQITK